MTRIASAIEWPARISCSRLELTLRRISPALTPCAEIPLTSVSSGASLRVYPSTDAFVTLRETRSSWICAARKPVFAAIRIPLRLEMGMVAYRVRGVASAAQKLRSMATEMPPPERGAAADIPLRP